MALPGSGQISLGDVQTEFGGTNPAKLSEYYSAAAGVPASGTIRLSDFHGTSASYLLAVTNKSFSDTSAWPTDVTNGVRIRTNGNVEENDTGIYSVRDQWMGAGGTASNYQVKATATAGASNVSGNSLGVWHSLSGSKGWNVVQTGAGPKTASLTIDIRNASDFSDAIQFTVSLSANAII